MKHLVITLTVFVTLSFSCFAQQNEQQTINEEINDGSIGWVASFGTDSSQVSTDNGYLSVAGVGGAGQYFVVNQKSPYQIATCTALKSSSWAAMGVTYYDSNWNEIESSREVITSDIRFGGVESRYSVSLLVPENAAYGYLWIWNNDSGGYVQVDGLRLVNYFPGAILFDGTQSAGDRFTNPPRNVASELIVNKKFNTILAANSRELFTGTEFWNIEDDDNSVGFTTQPAGGEILQVGGADQADLLYQSFTGLIGGETYRYAIKAGRSVFSAGTDAPWAIAGLDFFDADWNKVGAESVAIVDRSGLAAGGSGLVNEFTMPQNAVHGVAWIWTEATGNSDARLLVAEVTLRLVDNEDPQISLESVADVNQPQTNNLLRIRIEDNVAVNIDSLDQRDFEILGPNGPAEFIPISFLGRSVTDPDVYEYNIEKQFTSADNGTYEVEYQWGEINDFFNAPTGYTIIGSFDVNIGN